MNIRGTRLFAELSAVADSGGISVDQASSIVSQDWRGWLEGVPVKMRPDFESFFLFAEGFVEEVTEGFVEGDNDGELVTRARDLLAGLQSAGY